jgi:hypothetical protein
MEQCTSAVAGALESPSKCGHRFADRLAEKKSRALARHDHHQPVNGYGATIADLHGGSAPQASIAGSTAQVHADRKRSGPINRGDQILAASSHDDEHGLGRAAKITDHLVATNLAKADAVARCILTQTEGVPSIIAANQQTAESRSAALIREMARTSERQDFKPVNRRDEVVTVPIEGKVTQDAGTGLVAKTSSMDSLAQLIKDRDSKRGLQLVRGEDLEARRRAVPGLVPAIADDGNVVAGQRLVSTQPVHPQGKWRSAVKGDIDRLCITHGMPSQGRGGSNCWAKGNAGNMITDRPTSRVSQPPGGGCTLVVGKWG